MMPASWDSLAAAVDRAVDGGLEDLFGALRIPSVSAHREQLRESAEYLAGVLGSDGWDGQVVEVEGNPIVFAEIGPARAESSVVVYGHHDVQPVDPEAAWTSPPFEPTVRDGRLYCRGAADNKGQFFCHIFAVRALREVLGQVPVRVKLVLDGQEEIGSPQMPAFVAAMRERLSGARLCFTADGPTMLEDQPQVVFGVRGMLKLKLSVRTAATDLHSGNWGNLVPSAAWRLALVLARLKGPDGRVTVPGFYDAAVPPGRLEKEALAAIPFDEAAALRSVGAVVGDGPAGIGPLERVMFLPTLTVNGIKAGYVGEGFKTVIPSEAFAYVDVRLVVDQDPDDMFSLLQRHLAEIAPEARLENLGHFLPSHTPMDAQPVATVVEAVRRGFGQDPIRVPRIGGSLPDAVFAKSLGLPVLDVPYGAPDQRNHAPNENLRLDHMLAGARTSAALFVGLGDAGQLD